MALINCPKCGKQISDKAVKCPHCGFVPSSLQNEQLASSLEQQQPASESKRNIKLVNILLAVVGVLAIIVSLWIISNKEKFVPETTKTSVAKTNPVPYNTYFSGTIGTARGCMTIDNNGHGSYTYDCNGTDLTRNINVVSYNEKTGQLIIKSFNRSGEYVGVFEGYLDDSQLYSGTFTNYKGGTISFHLSIKNNKQPICVVIDGTELRLRLEPSTSADTFKWGDGTNRHLKVGEKFKYLNESGDFYQIDFHGHRLWVSKLYTHVE